MPTLLHPHSIDLPEAKGLQMGQILSHPRAPQPPQGSPLSLTWALLEDNACRGGLHLLLVGPTAEKGDSQAWRLGLFSELG